MHSITQSIPFHSVSIHFLSPPHLCGYRKYRNHTKPQPLDDDVLCLSTGNVIITISCSALLPKVNCIIPMLAKQPLYNWLARMGPLSLVCH